MIYHIADKATWNTAQDTGYYEHPSFASEGFIHTCSQKQIEGVRNRYYSGLKDLILLHIDESLVSSTIKYEPSPSLNEIFPHIYGPLNLDAVTKTEII